jgi:Asp-tRNA(Asn)/Glu-tRNA(Gln) amidotransferase A subunit family amidase
MRTVALLAWIAIVHVPSLTAQSDVQADVQTARADLQAQRTQLVAENLPLTEAEGQKFWPLYNEYRGKWSKLDDRAVALVQDYAANYEAMSDEKAKELLKQQLSIEEDRLKLRRSYLGKFEKVLPWKKTARYYQIERKLDAAIASETASMVPFVK